MVVRRTRRRAGRPAGPPSAASTPRPATPEPDGRSSAEAADRVRAMTEQADTEDDAALAAHARQALNPVDEDEPEPRSDSPVYVLVDGENIDATLGTSILGHRPSPGERPRWDRLMRFVQRTYGAEVKGLFFLAANGELPMSFVQALLAMDWRPVPLSGDAGQKVVDIAIIRTMEELRGREGDVVLVSNDGDFVEALDDLVDGERRLGVIGFTEFRNAGFTDLKARGVELFDLEYDVAAFRSPLPRVRIIPIDEFDPTQFL